MGYDWLVWELTWQYKGIILYKCNKGFLIIGYRMSGV
jgi:hypothetical protein